MTTEVLSLLRGMETQYDPTTTTTTTTTTTSPPFQDPHHLSTLDNSNQLDELFYNFSIFYPDVDWNYEDINITDFPFLVRAIERGLGATTTTATTGGEKEGAGSNSTDTALYQVPTGIVVLLSIFYGSISLIAVVGNALVMWIVATTRRMHSVTNYFIANLALADIIIGLFSIPFQ
ncbi:hypothetical protein Pmani_037574, partial [Petrolisthes manimaculis]